MRVFVGASNIVQNALAFIRKERNDYYKFGEDDKLPNEIIRIINDSGTARACVDRLTQFTQGQGFVDATLAVSKSNAMQSYNSLLSDLCLNVSYLKVVSFRVMFDNQGQPSRLYAVPSQLLRRRGARRFIYNDLMGYHHYRRGDDKKLMAYDPTEPPAERLKRIDKQIKDYGEQFGDIVYYFRKGLGLYQDVYSVPSYYSGIDDIESDAGISRLEKRNVNKGWKTPIIISTGPIDKDVKDDNGMTEYDKFEAVIEKFGSNTAPVALHLEGATNEAKPEVKTIPIADIMDQTEKATERVGRKVCRHMGVPPVLVGFSTAGQLGNTQELKNTMELFALTVVDAQNLIKEALKLVFPDKDWSITPLTIWNEAAKV
jgi:hypothetical protein